MITRLVWTTWIPMSAELNLVKFYIRFTGCLYHYIKTGVQFIAIEMFILPCFNQCKRYSSVYMLIVESTDVLSLIWSPELCFSEGEDHFQLSHLTYVACQVWQYYLIIHQKFRDVCFTVISTGGPCAIWDIYPKCILISILAKSRLPITYCSFAEYFWNLAQSTAVILQCSVQNFKMIGQLQRMLWMNKVLQDSSLRLVSDGYPMLPRAQGPVSLRLMTSQFKDIVTHAQK